MKRDAPFNPLIKSSASPKGLKFRLAEARDRDLIAKLMTERNPDEAPSDVMKKTDREIVFNSSDAKYRLFVADLDGLVVGLCRCYHSAGLPKEKLIFAAPHGWYCMGLLVDQEFRRKGIARFLFDNRLKFLKVQGAEVIYSAVEATNLSSIHMHERFGFEEIQRAIGFLHLKFDDGGILYRMFV